MGIVLFAPPLHQKSHPTQALEYLSRAIAVAPNYVHGPAEVWRLPPCGKVGQYFIYGVISPLVEVIYKAIFIGG